ncbi:MAG: LysM domain-containing protein [Planctomycetota bacterium]|nr:LysM domain-containing protein [Planctomycetota bacterium]
MQRIERYGIVAMIFLIVTIAAITFWDEGDPPRVEEPRLAARAQAVGTAQKRQPVPSDLKRARKARAQAPLAGGERAGARDTVARDLERIPGGPASGAGATRVEPFIRRTNAAARNERRGAMQPVAPVKAPVAEPAPRPQEVAVEPQETVYLVKAGDTLSEIAQATLGSARRWHEIVELNPGVGPASLRVGAILRLPEVVGPISASTPAPTPAPAPARVAHTRVDPLLDVPASDRTHIVAPGEVLSVIAQRELGSARRWREIVDFNPGLDPDRLKVGTVLALPEGPPVSTDTSLVARATVRPTASGSARVR